MECILWTTGGVTSEETYKGDKGLDLLYRYIPIRGQSGIVSIVSMGASTGDAAMPTRSLCHIWQHIP